VNMMMENNGRERVRAAYHGNYDRLVQVTQRYDQPVPHQPQHSAFLTCTAALRLGARS